MPDRRPRMSAKIISLFLFFAERGEGGELMCLRPCRHIYNDLLVRRVGSVGSVVVEG